MNKIIFIFNSEERRYLACFTSPFYFEVSAPAGVFFITFTEESSESQFQLEIMPDLDPVTSHIISLEETDFFEKAFELIYTSTEFYIKKMITSDLLEVDLDVLIDVLSRELSALAKETASNHESYQHWCNHVETVEHPMIDEDPNNESSESVSLTILKR